MKDAKGHGSNPRNNRAERVALGQQLDNRNRIGVRPWDRPSHGVGQMDKIIQGLRNQYGANAPSEAQVRLAMQTGAHTAGIHASTMGKTLAQASAAGTNPNIPPPTIAGSK